MLVVDQTITVDELKEMASKMFGGMIKAVVDLEKRIMVIDGEMHGDEEFYCIMELESQQEDLWGINLYPSKAKREHWIEFDSMINVRPSSGNKSRKVENVGIQKQIAELVNTLVIYNERA
ncbi:MAG: DUF5674 family protein [Candidatus Dependentiae bacterium]|nr:DUF5674 family protein [Candidatus Dependentiae bacterium]